MFTVKNNEVIDYVTSMIEMKYEFYLIGGYKYELH